MIPQILAAFFVLAVASIHRWIKLNQQNWSRRVGDFQSKHHGYITATTNKSKDDDVLLIVCPTSGCGAAMKEFPAAIQQLEAQGRRVEVYVTESGDDLRTLATRKDLGPYKMIAILAGDSSVFEFIQPVFRRFQSWPYSAILHLPGGLGNAMPNEFYRPIHQKGEGQMLTVREIIQRATKVKKAGVIKASNGKAGGTYYAIHNAFDGVQVALIDWMERNRAITSVLGDFGFVFLVLVFLLTLPFRKINPIVLNICKSDFEGQGLRLGFGVTRFDGNMAVVTGGPYKSKIQLVKAYFCFISGTLGKKHFSKLFQNKKNGLPYGLSVDVCKEYKTMCHRHRMYFDGSTAYALKGDTISFHVIENAISYYVV